MLKASVGVAGRSNFVLVYSSGTFFAAGGRLKSPKVVTYSMIGSLVFFAKYHFMLL